jgi:hypothetical protein
MGDLLVSKLWIAAAENALVEADVALSEVQFATVRAQLRAAAREAEGLMNLVADGTRSERTEAVRRLVERYGDLAAEIDDVAALAVGEAVARAAVQAGVDLVDAERLGEAIRRAVLDASAAVDRLAPLLSGRSRRKAAG